MGGPRPFEIQVAGADEGNELIDCLWRHGLPARLVEASGLWHVEVRSIHENPPELLADLFSAVQSWRPRGDGPVPLHRVGERRYSLRRPN